MKKREGCWLVAVSTGPDSMYLLQQCLLLQMDIQIAFVNYHFRAQAEQEEVFIRQYAHQYHLPLHVLNAEFKPTGNFEAAARKWRYDFFAKLVLANNLKGVLVAHHQDDLLETYFMQVEKQIEPNYFGLKQEVIINGIKVVRPLLDLQKRTILSYLDKNKIPYFIDHTNMQDDYRRNQIRHHIIKKLNDIERCQILAEIKHKNKLLKIRRNYVQSFIHENKIRVIDYRQLLLIERLTALRFLLEEDQHYSQSHLRELDKLMMTKDDFDLELKAKHLVIDKKNIFVFFVKPYYFQFKTIVIGLYTYFKIEKGQIGVNALTVKESDYPLIIRPYKSGDFIQMFFGKKKISRFFIDRKIPRYQRKVWPIVCNCLGKVILVPGLGCDIDHFSINPSFNVVQYFGNEELLCGKKKQ